MATWIEYLWPVPQADDSSEQPYLQLIRSPITDDTREQMIERITAIAYNGEYTIEDDGEPAPAPTQLDRIEAQTTYTALMTDTLLEG